MPPETDPIALASALIRRPSVTPEDAGALDVLQGFLEAHGFRCRRLPFDGDGSSRVDNLYARFGRSGPNFCFAGHTDVVPVGDPNAWSRDPFGGEVAGGVLHGRGASDMKAAVAAFAVAAARYIAACDGGLPGSISLLITGDEEGEAVNGTRKVLEWLAAEGEALDSCVVGEPTNPTRLGEMVKIGRRGSLSGEVRVFGTQGHVAYPHLADNPVPPLLALLGALDGHVLDQGTPHFQPSNLEITSVDVGNPASNVIPAEARARFNIRFNDLHTGASLRTWIEGLCSRHAGAHEVEIRVSGEAFLTPPGALSDLLVKAIEGVLGATPELSTSGGTSDARFIKDYCPVAEFGLVGATMHKVDEQIPVADVERLTEVYGAVLERYFER